MRKSPSRILADFPDVRLRRHAGFPAKHPYKIADVAKAGLFGDFRNAQPGGFQKLRRSGQAIFQQIFREGHVHGLLKIPAAFVAAHEHAPRKRRQRKFFRVMLMEIANQAVNLFAVRKGRIRPLPRRMRRKPHPCILQAMLNFQPDFRRAAYAS